MKSSRWRSSPLITLCGLAAILAAFACANSAETSSPIPALADSTATPPAPLLPPLSPNIPFDVTVPSQPPPTLDSLQHDFDVMSWETFVALNWPVLANGQPNPEQQPGQNKDNSTFWQTWKTSQEVFLPNGAPRTPWGTPLASSPLPALCRDQLQPGEHILTQVGKTPNLLTESIQPFNNEPLIDQNGRYARFEILMNQTMFDHIVANKLYSKKTQASVTSVVFPCGTTDPKDPQVGTIMLKASWKILNPAEIQGGRFHTMKALIYTPPSANPPIKEKCEHATVGLVGLHMVHKTKDAAQWVWSTFEHIDNCPTEGQPMAGHAYSFYNPATPKAAINTPPARPWNPNNIEPPARRPQIVRILPIDPPTQQLNASYQAALRAVNPASVWQYYELVSTQWPTQPASSCDVETSAPTDMTGTPAPQFLGNSTLESYIQGKVPNVSSSCIECHLNATTTTHVFSDFTYLLERAQ